VLDFGNGYKKEIHEEVEENCGEGAAQEEAGAETEVFR
jgi:hypothetical protein